VSNGYNTVGLRSRRSRPYACFQKFNFFYELLLAVGSGGYPDRRWTVSCRLVCRGIYSANSGLPLTVVESTSAWELAAGGSISAGAIPIIR